MPKAVSEISMEVLSTSGSCQSRPNVLAREQFDVPESPERCRENIDVLLQKPVNEITIDETASFTSIEKTNQVTGTKRKSSSLTFEVTSPKKSCGSVIIKTLSRSSSATLSASSPSRTLSCSSLSATLSCSPKILSPLKLKTRSEFMNMQNENSYGKIRRRTQLLRKHYVGDFSDADITNPKMARKGFYIAKKKIVQQQQKITLLQQRVRRLSMRVRNMNSLLKELKKQQYISEEAANVIKVSVPNEAKLIFERMLRGAQNQKYSPCLRSFAITLNFYSPRAYSFVRKVFNKSLPHPSTISRWYQSLDGRPGFSNEALNMLKRKAATETSKNKFVVCNLVVDEMTIRKQVEFSKGRFVGYVDIGTNINADSLPEAREALVLMLVALNGCWKLPVGYFLINGLSASERAVIIRRCLELVEKTGVLVKSVTFDGSASNMGMAKELGADFSDFNNLRAYFQHPVNREPVYIFPDPCHMIKLIRNCWGTYRIIQDDQENVDWSYLTKLVDIQNTQGLHAGNKLRKRHLDWVKEKMKVKIATQTLSKSVSDALIYLRSIDEKFKGCEATAKFVLLFNNLFDIFNSRNRFAKYCYKRPISQSNKEHIFQYIDAIREYIISLQVDNKPLLESARKTGFLGFLICIDNIQKLYNELVEEKKQLKYVSTYKLSQDHLELFFGAVRSKGGYNNNPTAKQFEAAYKRLMTMNEIRVSESGNAIPLEDIPILQCGSAICQNEYNENIIETPAYKEYQETIIPLIDHDYISPSTYSLTDYVLDIVGYISGFVVKSIKKCIMCFKCLKALESEYSPSKLQAIKEYKNLTKASNFVLRICKIAESTFRFMLHTSNIMQSKANNVIDIFINKILIELPTDIFDELGEHFFDAGDELDNHCIELVKIILRSYLKIRIHYETKKMVEKNIPTRVRSMLTKTILFKNQ